MVTEPAAESNTPINEEWIDLSGDGGVLKKVRSPELVRKIGSGCLYIQQLSWMPGILLYVYTRDHARASVLHVPSRIHRCWDGATFRCDEWRLQAVFGYVKEDHMKSSFSRNCSPLPE